MATIGIKIGHAWGERNEVKGIEMEKPSFEMNGITPYVNPFSSRIQSQGFETFSLQEPK